MADFLFDQNQRLLEKIKETTEEIRLLEIQVSNPGAQLKLASLVGGGDPRTRARVKLKVAEEHLGALLSEKSVVKKLLDERRAAQLTRHQESRERLSWKGTLRELAEMAEPAIDAGKIEARNKSDAWDRLAGHFTKDGRPISGRSLQQNLRNKKEELTPTPQARSS
jgi:hypothetical protein